MASIAARPWTTQEMRMRPCESMYTLQLQNCKVWRERGGRATLRNCGFLVSIMRDKKGFGHGCSPRMLSQQFAKTAGEEDIRLARTSRMF
jgi:hypothetical protein